MNNYLIISLESVVSTNNFSLHNPFSGPLFLMLEIIKTYSYYLNSFLLQSEFLI